MTQFKAKDYHRTNNSDTILKKGFNYLQNETIFHKVCQITKKVVFEDYEKNFEQDTHFNFSHNKWYLNGYSL
jgi:hypothetical protein